MRTATGFTWAQLRSLVHAIGEERARASGMPMKAAAMQKCENCGEQAPAGAEKCPHCGKAMPQHGQMTS